MITITRVMIMEDLSLHILDIAENAIRAGAKRIEIAIVEDREKDVLSIGIKDDGKGMDEETLKRATDPFFTTKRGKRVGLGLSLLAQAAAETNGSFEIRSKVDRGTSIRATFRRSHVDRKPLGDMDETLAVLAAGHPGIRLIYKCSNGESSSCFDSWEEQK